MTLYGYDISGWQAALDPGQVPGDFVVVKATGGKGYVNPYCDKQVQAARASGKEVAVYHFVHDPGHPGTAEEEADWFLAHTRGYQDGSIIFIMDWEGDNVADSGYALRFKERFEAGANIRLMVYASISKLSYLKPCLDAGSPIWAAGYSAGYAVINGYNPPAGPNGVPSWAPVSMWQFTSSGRLPGYADNLDLNVFYGDRAAWRKLAAKLDGTIAPQATPTPVPVQAPTPAPAVAPVPLPATGGGPTKWIVDPGNSMSQIAAAVGVSLGALIAANPGVYANLIHPGQTLALPAGAHWPQGAVPAPVSAPKAGPTLWIVDPGDTMGGIAAKTGVSLARLIAVNPGVNPNLIHPGQRLHLPAGAHW